MIQIKLKKGKETSILRHHPWIFSGAVSHLPETLKDGEIVEIVDAQEKYLATAYYQKEGSIAFKIISFEQQTIDRLFWTKKIQAALLLRQKGNFLNKKTNIFRWINGESDGFPGLVVDCYAKVLVFQAHAWGIYQFFPIFVEIFKELLQENLIAIYNKSEETLKNIAEIKNIKNQYLYQNPKHPIDFLGLENDILFHIDWEQGQKTGFFIDQRENRKLLGQLAEGKNVLNTFCYSGGFSLYALKNKAKSVVSVDSSQRALEFLNQNLRLNQLDQSQHQAICSDVNLYLKQMEADFFDLIILDPPAFAKKISARHKALQAYKQLNLLALKKVKKEGFIFTFSCSQAMDLNLFEHTVRSAAIEAQRDIKIVQYLHQPWDHAVSIFYPEGQYLKGLLLHIQS